MAVEKVYKCDLCGEYVHKQNVAVVRVGTIEDRPEACTRLEVGPECADRPVRELLAKAGGMAEEEGVFR